MKLTVERLREVLRYEPTSGLFIWRMTVGNVQAGEVAGCLVDDGYIIIGIDGHLYRAHRLAWLYMTGEWPPNDVDHHDRDKTNNRWINLRKATRSQNHANKVAQINNSSGFKGVWAHQGKWRSAITVNGCRKYLGLFSTPEEAAAAYQAAAVEHFGEFARTA